MAAFNPETGEVESGTVSDTFVHEQVATWELTTDTGSVITTAVHPFYVEGKGWVEAQDLRVGDQLRDESGGLVAVVSIAATGDVATVYNFTVEQHHDYHVQTGRSWVLVHNSIACTAKDLELAHSHVTDTGETVLGRYPRYIERAKEKGASYFDIGDDWNRLAREGKDPWELNVAFLDGRIKAGDKVIFSLPKSAIDKLDPMTYTAREVEHLREAGYKWVNQWAMHPPKPR